MNVDAFVLASVNGVFSDIPPDTREMLLIFGSLLGALVVAVVWIVYFRKSSRRHRHHHHTRSRNQVPQKDETLESAQPIAKKRRVRRSRHPQRAFNPTLAQTRGLPPLRNGQQQSTSQF